MPSRSFFDFSLRRQVAAWCVGGALERCQAVRSDGADGDGHGAAVVVRSTGRSVTITMTATIMVTAPVQSTISRCCTVLVAGPVSRLLLQWRWPRCFE